MGIWGGIPQCVVSIIQGPGKRMLNCGGIPWRGGGMAAWRHSPGGMAAKSGGMAASYGGMAAWRHGGTVAAQLAAMRGGMAA